jgi:hypothetical protein
MLAGILLNLPVTPPVVEDCVNSGPLRGALRGSTGWNKTWAEDYGPNVDKARKAKEVEVQVAIDALKEAKGLPVYFEDAKQEVKKRTLAADLMKHDTELVSVMTAYYSYLKWKRDEDDVTSLLLLM